MESRRQAVAAVERQTAVLTRHFELMNRRNDLHKELDRAGYLLLRALHEAKSANINKLAALLGVDPSTAGRQVAALQRAGLVARTPDPADRRCNVVTPTEEGLSLMLEVQRARTKATDELLADWSEEDLRTFDAVLGKFNRTVAARYLTAFGEAED